MDRPLTHVTDVLPWHGPPCDPCVLARGTHVHHACHLLDTTGLDWSTVHTPWSGYVRAWEACKRDTGLEVLASEVKVVNAKAGYCGRLDRVVRFITRHPYVLDLKTGGPTPTVGPQTAAYAEAFKESAPVCFKGRLPKRRAVCQLSEDGTYRLTTEDTKGQTLFGPNDYRVFLSYLTTYTWEVAHGLRPAPPPREDD